jgi:hypothetical protein
MFALVRLRDDAYPPLFDPSTNILGPIGARDQTQITACHNHTVKVRMAEKEKEKK